MVGGRDARAPVTRQVVYGGELRYFTAGSATTHSMTPHGYGKRNIVEDLDHAVDVVNIAMSRPNALVP